MAPQQGIAGKCQVSKSHGLQLDVVSQKGWIHILPTVQNNGLDWGVTSNKGWGTIAHDKGNCLKYVRRCVTCVFKERKQYSSATQSQVKCWYFFSSMFYCRALICSMENMTLRPPIGTQCSLVQKGYIYPWHVGMTMFIFPANQYLENRRKKGRCKQGKGWIWDGSIETAVSDEVQHPVMSKPNTYNMRRRYIPKHACACLGLDFTNWPVHSLNNGRWQSCSKEDSSAFIYSVALPVHIHVTLWVFNPWNGLGKVEYDMHKLASHIWSTQTCEWIQNYPKIILISQKEIL